MSFSEYQILLMASPWGWVVPFGLGFFGAGLTLTLLAVFSRWVP